MQISSTCVLALLAGTTIIHAATLSSTDKQFLITAARTDMIEAHEGQMAEDQAQQADIKDLGKTLVQDHTQSYEELTALAAKTGVSIPTGINTAREATIEQLARLKGNSFDRAFDRDEIAAHKRLVASFKREAEHAKDPDVKAYATKMIPVVEKHLKLAEDCAKPVKKT